MILQYHKMVGFEGEAFRFYFDRPNLRIDEIDRPEGGPRSAVCQDQYCRQDKKNTAHPYSSTLPSLRKMVRVEKAIFSGL
jgi:hypothetical protein